MSQPSEEPVKAATQKLIVKQAELFNLMILAQEDLQRHASHPRTVLEEVKQLWNQHLANHTKICKYPAASTTPYYVEKHITTAKYKCSDISRAVHQQLDAQVPRPTSVAPSILGSNATKLPRLNLPTFSGSYLEWEAFRDLFESVVHQNPALSDVQRLHYLRTCLRGEALARIDGMPLTDEEYAGAWSALRERYDNKRLVVSNHVDHLISLPAVKSDSASDLRSLCDNTARVLRSMENLGRKDHLGIDICVYLTVQRLSPSIRKDWEKHLGEDTTPPNLSDLLKFLESSIRALESSSSTVSRHISVSDSPAPRSRPQKTRALLATSGNARSCPCCNGAHYVGRGAEFRKQTPEQRTKLVNQHKLCLNCLSYSHPTKNCKSDNKCMKCQRSHHSLLHMEPSASAPREEKSLNEPIASKGVVNLHAASQASWESSPVLLATAMVILRSSTGRCCRVRALLDQGAESCFISENVVQMLRLSKRRIDAPIFSIGESHTATAKSAVRVDLGSVYNSEVIVELVALVLPRLTKATPPRMPATGWPHLEGLQLADPSYGSSIKIELIIGADIYGPLLRNGVRQEAPGSSTAQQTVLGWILSGKLYADSRPTPKVTCSHASTLEAASDHEISDLIRRFWEIEELQSTRALIADEQECEKNFVTTHQRNAHGRYTVPLPFKETSLPNFRSSRTIAVNRLEYLERRFARDSKLSSKYSDFLEEYETLGHMVPTEFSDSTLNAYYMPHHAVIRETSTTTKLRVVFNALQRTKDGVSLNDVMLTGPALQRDLFAVILKWRVHRYVFSADIEKMYRQIRVHSDDCRFQRIVWRDAPTSPIRDYALTTVTYATASAPFLALRTLQQLASDEEARFPLGAAVVREDFYVDNVLSGAENLDCARARQRETISLLASGGFRLRKWIANKPELLQSIPQEDRLLPSSRALQPDEHVRTLSVYWNATTDTFHFQVQPIHEDGLPTKRRVLSVIARLFDPLGWLAPVVARAKILMQRLWSAQLDWDQALPSDLSNEWSTYQQELPQLSQLAIPRWTQQTAATSYIEFHGFCDASIHAYAAAVYIRVTDDNHSHIVLLAAKTKVAPLKQLSIPRLELCGALLLTRLLNIVTTSMGFKKVPTHAWTDSRIVLAWLTGHPTRWTCFVANRVSEIQFSELNISWHHVLSKDNPADCASRGTNPSELSANNLWWHGPTWVQKSSSFWPKDRTQASEDAPLEERRTIHVHLAEAPQEDCNRRIKTLSPQRQLGVRLPGNPNFIRTRRYLSINNAETAKA